MTNQNQLELGETTSEDGATVSVSIGGEIDATNAGEISSVVTVAAGRVGVRRVVVDLSGVTFMDSSGISSLIVCQNGLDAVGVDFEVVGARDGALRLLELTGVLDFLTSSSAHVPSASVRSPSPQT